MSDAGKNEQVCDLYTKGSHHRILSVICLMQNLFHQGKQSRTISLNSNYLILLKNPRDQQQISVLGRQIYPNNPCHLLDVYKNAVSRPHGHLVVDLKQDTPESERLKPNIFEVSSSSPWWSNTQDVSANQVTFEPAQSILGNDVDSHVTFEPPRSIMGDDTPIKEIENHNSSHSRFDSRSVNIDKGLIDTLLNSLPKQLSRSI